jgi:two-component system NarL family sensor kinase
MNAAGDPSLLADVADDGRVAAIVTDGTDRVLRATDAAAELLGLPVSRLNGRHLCELAADGWQGTIEDALLRMHSGSNEPFDAMLLGRSGRRAFIRMIPRRALASAGAVGYVLFWRRLAFAVEPPRTRSEGGLRRLGYQLLRKHDTHRRRTAAELHDDVASLITVAKLTLESAAGNLKRGQSQDISSILLDTSQHLRETLVNVRRISTELHPSSLDDLGLVATIDWLSRRLKKVFPEIRVELQLDVEESTISPGLKIDIYRIIEEALLNAAYHASASRARVRLCAMGDQIELSIEDDGGGFDAAPYLRGEAEHPGVGLHSIETRVESTHGSLRVESMPGTGTTIVATWPGDSASLSPR